MCLAPLLVWLDRLYADLSRQAVTIGTHREKDVRELDRLGASCFSLRKAAVSRQRSRRLGCYQ
jgi:hypothetical protein